MTARQNGSGWLSRLLSRKQSPEGIVRSSAYESYLRRLKKENPVKYRDVLEREVDARVNINTDTGESWQYIGDKRVSRYGSKAMRQKAEKGHENLQNLSRSYTIKLPS